LKIEKFVSVKIKKWMKKIFLKLKIITENLENKNLLVDVPLFPGKSN